MKKIYLFIAALLIFSSLYSQEKTVLDGLGKFKLGMSSMEVEKLWGKPLVHEEINPNHFYAFYMGFVYITESLYVDGFSVSFYKGKVIAISCNFDEQLHNGLKTIYGIKKKKFTSLNDIFYIYNTGANNIISVALESKNIMIFSDGLSNSISHQSYFPALREWNKNENFKGL